MEPLIIPATIKTPKIHFDPASGVFDLEGMSYPEYGKEFYKPVLEWVSEYIKTPNGHTELNIKFKYFNTSSAKSILSILQKFNEVRSNGHTFVVNWYYEPNDEQMIQDGENYSTLLKLPFNMVQLG